MEVLTWTMPFPALVKVLARKSSLRPALRANSPRREDHVQISSSEETRSLWGSVTSSCRSYTRSSTDIRENQETQRELSNVAKMSVSRTLTRRSSFDLRTQTFTRRSITATCYGFVGALPPSVCFPRKYSGGICLSCYLKSALTNSC